MALRNKSLSTAEALISLINDEMLDRRTAFPGQIKKINTSSSGSLISIDVQPQIKQTISQEDSDDLIYRDLPVLHRVPIVYPHSNLSGYALTVPVAVGDQVLVVIADRAIDKWQETGAASNPVETATPRAHDLSDAIAIIGLCFDKTNIPNYSFEKICLRNRDSTKSVCVGSNVEIKSGSSTIVVSNSSITETSSTIVINGTTTTINGNTITLSAGGTTLTVSSGGVSISGGLTVNGIDFDQFFSNYSSHYHNYSGGSTSGPIN